MQFITKNKTIHDLVDDMKNYGLLVDYNKLNTTGKIARCSTKSKPYKKNGWYVVYTQDNFINAAFGDYQRNESPIRWHNKQQLNITEKNQIRANAALTQKHIQTEKHQKALYYANKYAQFEHCINHNYTTNKKINNLDWYNLRHYTNCNNDLLCIPFFDSYGIIKGYQTINTDSTKRFCGSVSGCFWQYPINNLNSHIFNNYNSFYLIGEGLATVLSAKQAIEDYFDSSIFMAYALVAFNCSNLDKVVKSTKHHGLCYFLLIDNDSNNLYNAGIETAKQLIVNNPHSVIYPVTFNNGNDANDYILANGANAFIGLLTKQTPILNFMMR